MRIRFTKHAEAKFAVLRRHGVLITRSKVIETVLHPEFVDSKSRMPLHISQSAFDVRRVLRVVYRIEYGTIVIVTFYPGRKSQYEK